MSSEWENLYESEIHPLVERIVLICKQLRMPAFITFQMGEDGFITTCTGEHHSQFDTVKLLRLVNQSGSLDTFIEAVKQDALINGHQSEFLDSLGIAREPGK